jgi:hypothetical protein
MSHFVTAFDGPYNFSSSPPKIDQTTFSGQPVSGFDATGSAGTYDGASANFNIPTVTNTLLCTTPYFSIWTGLGGQDTSRLIQTGMIYNLGQVPQPNSSDWTSFYELIDSAHNNPPVNLIIAAGKSWHVNTGDIMYSQTTYSSPSGGTAFLYLEDQTSGLSANVTLTGISAYYDGTTADAFVENHPNFPFVISQINWQYDWAELSASGIWDPILNVPQNKYIGIYSTPSTLSTTDNTSFNVNSTYKCT